MTETNLNYGRLAKQATNVMSRHLDAFAASYGLTGVQLSTIDFLARQKNQSVLQKDIEVEFSIRRSSATTLLQRMAQKELISLSKSAADERQKEVHLTAKSQDLIQVVGDYLEVQQNSLEANFTPTQLRAFSSILTFLKKDEAGKNYKKNGDR